MATIREITTLCKEGHETEAMQLALADLNKDPDNIWAQREVGWALYYSIKTDIANRDFDNILSHLRQLMHLKVLNPKDDDMIYSNVLFKLGEYIKNQLQPSDLNSFARLSLIFSIIRNKNFIPSKGYSFLLQSVLKFDNWVELSDFFDWWDLTNLTTEDYTPFVNNRGQKIMTLAERAIISYSKALLKTNDLTKIELFLPFIDDVMNAHPEMTYPGYFYGKLLMTLGSNQDEALKVIVPFARKKATEFWVWDLLSSVFSNESEKQLACLLRAVNCRTQESFLGKVRIKLATFYVQRQQYDYAKAQIDAVTKCYMSNGWRVPYEIDAWLHEPWLSTATPKVDHSVDYISITNDLLLEGTKEALAVATYFNLESKKCALIYGFKRKTMQKLRFKVSPGEVLRINFVPDGEGRVKILNSTKVKDFDELPYLKVTDGIIRKRPDKNFAFLKSSISDCFISPQIVESYKLQDADHVKALIAYDFDKKNNEWNWICIKIIK